jgi:hypothetical protein
MDINKIFNELGRMHLEIMQLREQLAEAEAKLNKRAEATKAEVAARVPPKS